jgi:hypothetical protein
VADTFQVLFGDQATGANSDFYNQLTSLEVEENADLPGAVELTLNITTQGADSSQDFTQVGDDRFKPYARIAVVATPDGQQASCIFDGYVLSHKIHVEPGTTGGTLRVWGQDVSCIMNLKEVVKPWTKSDAGIANDIFDTYGFTKASDNTPDDAPTHPDDVRPLMQRSTDAQFLRDRARRNGKLFRVTCDRQAGRNTGYFIKPKLDGATVATLTLNPATSANVDALDFEWDVARPTTVLAKALLTSKDPEDAGATDTGLSLLDSRSLAQFINNDNRKMEARLTAPTDNTLEVQQRAKSILREAAWFVKCEGETDLARLNKILRVASLVQINGAGRLHSGKYFVWSVRHSITLDRHRMRFVLVRNAVGSS